MARGQTTIRVKEQSVIPGRAYYTYQYLCLHYEVVRKEGRLTDAETVKVKMCVWRTSVQTV